MGPGSPEVWRTTWMALAGGCLVAGVVGHRLRLVPVFLGAAEAAILEAEGAKCSQILQAEGEAEAVQTLAEAERFRQQTVAEGEADAIRSVYQAIHDGRPTSDLLAVKYLESLEAIADGQATKIFLPTEATAVLGSLGGMAEVLTSGRNGKVNGTPARRTPVSAA
jgi:hypothetical protein